MISLFNKHKFMYHIIILYVIYIYFLMFFNYTLELFMLVIASVDCSSVIDTEREDGSLVGPVWQSGNRNVSNQALHLQLLESSIWNVLGFATKDLKAKVSAILLSKSTKIKEISAPRRIAIPINQSRKSPADIAGCLATPSEQQKRENDPTWLAIPYYQIT